MRVEDGKIVYEDTNDRMMAIAAVIREVFDRPHGFVLVVHDFERDQTPTVIDNYQHSPDAVALLRSVVDYYHDAVTKTFHVTADGNFKATEPRAPAPKEDK